jgi:hypothetical protein
MKSDKEEITVLWKREEYIAHMNFEYTGREMFCEIFGILVGLDNEWKAQGATNGELTLSAFDWDYVLKTHTGANCRAITGIEPRILEDNDEYAISIDSYGRKAKLCKSSATIPLPFSYPVESFDDWLKIKHWYEFREERVDLEAAKKAKELQSKGHLVFGWIEGGFDGPRQLMGEENLCVAYYEQPELIYDMLNTMAGTTLKVYERVFDVVKLDCLCVHEDMAGKSGPLSGPVQINEFIKPYYRKIWDEVSRHGCSIFSQDSDGDMTSVIDSFLECGVNSMYPCEPAAGMDIVSLRQKYGKKLSFKGGIDKFALRGTKEDIKNELLYKMCDATKGGGTVFAIDHRVPNGVSLENYKYYAALGREILNLPPVSQESANRHWEKMAF